MTPEYEDEALVAWFQTDYGRQLVELVDEPHRVYNVPPTRFSWVRVKCRLFKLGSESAYMSNGQDEVLVDALHPLTPAARELLSVVPPRTDWKGRWL